MLSALIRPLRSAGAGAIDRYDLGGAQRLVIGQRGNDRGGLDAAGRADWPGSPPLASHSSAGALTGVLTANAKRVGLDLETLERVAANTSTDDDWLSDRERTSIAEAACPALEMACCWMLKEAYGKALGVGLALPLAALSFCQSANGIRLLGTAAPSPAAGWSFGLWRRDTLLVATAIMRASSDDDTVRAGGEKTANVAA